MERGTTPTHTFEVPFEKATIKTVKITYSQNDNVVFSKKTEDCTIEDGKISVKLTQEETLACKLNSLISIQVRILTQGGDALSSDIIVDTIQKSLDDEVLV